MKNFNKVNRARWAKNKLFKFKWLLLSFILSIASLNQAWGQNFKSVPTENKIQSQQIMSGGAYNGTVYEPFSNTTPSQQSYSPAKAPSGPRRAGEGGNNDDFDPNEFDTPGDGGTPSNESPIGEPWVMLLLALGFIGIIFIRKHKLNQTTKMKSTNKFITTLALLFTLGVGQMWGYTITNGKRIHFLNYGGWNGVCIKSWNGGTEYWPGCFSQFGSTKMYYWDAVNGRSDLSGWMLYETNNNGTNSGAIYEELKNNCVVIKKSGSDGAYIFTTYAYVEPSGGATIYFDNTYFDYPTDKIYLRAGFNINDGGNKGGNEAIQLTHVYGTDALYKVTLPCGYPYHLYTISNNDGWQNLNTIYNIGAENNHHVTKQIPHVSTNVTGDYTIISKLDNGNRSYAGGDGCNYYNYETIGGHTRNVSITAPSHGTITVSYRDESNSPQSFTSGNRDLAQTCVLTITSTPASGYSRAGLTLDGSPFTSGNTHTLRSNITLAATFTANEYTLTFNKNGEAWSDAAAATTKTRKIVYDAAYSSSYESQGAIPTMATKNGYYFSGWYTASSGGLQVIDGDGNWVHNVSDYTDGSGNWVHAGDQTLYAQYAVPVISISFSPENVLPLDTVTVTPSFDHDPEGASTLCYVLVTGGGQEMQVQPTFVPGTGNSLKFEAPSAPGDYSVDVRLFNAADHSCADRTTGLVSSYLSRATTFTVEEANAVTVKYKCGSVELRPSTTVYATAYQTAASITAPDIAGLSFASWDTSDEHVWLTPGSTSISKTIQVKADAAATVIANYGQGSLFFKDTKKWVVNPETDSVYIYFYSANKWTTSKGNPEGTGSNGTNFISGPFGMSLLDGTDDVYYFNEAKHGTIPTFAAVAFSKERMPNYNFFAGADSDHPCNVVYVNAFDKTNRPMIVPVGGGATWNYDKCRYYAHDLASLLPDWGYDLRGDNDFIGWVPASDAAKHKMKAAKLGDLSFMTDIYFDGAYDNKEWKVYNGNEGYGREDNQKLTQTSPTSGVLTNHNDGWNMKIQTNVPGAYTFKLTFGTECTDGGTDAFSGAAATNGLMKHMTVTVLYPVNKGDYRLFHSTKKHPGDVIRKRGNCKDTVSMYVGTGQSLDIKMQTCTAVAAGSVTWGSPVALTYADGVNFATILSTGGSGVYNFIVEQDANGVPTIIAVEKYAGNYYVRTDCTNSYHKNYKDVKDDCQMTYSEYSMSSALAANKQYSHYYVKDLHGSGGSPIDIRFTVATDYSESITDTVTTGITADATDPHYDFYGNASLNRVANVRFSYNEATNEIWRAYTEGPTNNDYMVLRTDGAKVYESSSAVSPTSTYKFADMGNWVYQVDVYASAPTYVKLTAEMHNSGGTGNTQYLKGNTYDDDYDEDDAVILLGGTAVKQHMRIVYDFKTDRMVTSWIPNGAVSGNVGINADVMLIRNGQDDTQQITFAAGDANKLTDVKTVYGVMEFDSMYVNNIVLSRYARSLYWISFPFDVNVRDIFGFGTYGKHWILEYYDGMGRAKNGWWADSEPNWKYITPAMKDTFVLEANTGYVLALSLNRMADGCTDVWVKDVNTVYLYFPSATELGTIQNVASKTMPLSQTGYKCEIDRTGNDGADINKNRKIADSYWHCIGVPSFAQNSLSGTATSSTWASNIPFVYEWNSTTNRLTVNTNGSFTFEPMHAYLVQYDGTSITWSNVSNKPAAIVARRKVQEADADFYEWKLNLMRGSNEIDQTYVRMTTNEDATDGFDFGQDLTKEMNVGGNLYTFSTYVPVAGNSLALDLNMTKTVRVGVQIAADGEYTFSMPDGTSGISVTLVDNATGIRTNLALTDYSVTLPAGTYDERFTLELAPIANAPTDIENTTITNDEIRKVVVDGTLYIIRDGKVYDATGTRVK